MQILDLANVQTSLAISSDWNLITINCICGGVLYPTFISVYFGSVLAHFSAMYAPTLTFSQTDLVYLGIFYPSGTIANYKIFTPGSNLVAAPPSKNKELCFIY